MELKDKVVLITGSSSGIGKAIAIRLASEGAKIVINYNSNKEGGESTLSEIQSLGNEGLVVQADISDESQAENLVKTVIDKFGTIDILVNNAGGYIDGDDWNGESEAWLKTFQKNILSVMNVSKYVLREFIEAKKGNIVSIATRYSLSGQYDSPAYSASKAGIVNLTQGYAKLLSPFGRANCISPGAVEAGYWLRAPKEELDETLETIPFKRLISKEEVAEMVFYLSSEHSKSITGQNFLIDGGFNLK